MNNIHIKKKYEIGNGISTGAGDVLLTNTPSGKNSYAFLTFQVKIMGHRCLTLRQATKSIERGNTGQDKDKRVKLSVSNEKTALWFQLPEPPNPCTQNRAPLMILTIEFNPPKVVDLCLKPDTYPADQLFQIVEVANIPSSPISAFILMGQTGVGKSSFINLLNGKDMKGQAPEVSDEPESCKLPSP